MVGCLLLFTRSAVTTGRYLDTPPSPPLFLFFCSPSQKEAAFGVVVVGYAVLFDSFIMLRLNEMCINWSEVKTSTLGLYFFLFFFIGESVLRDRAAVVLYQQRLRWWWATFARV